MCNWIDCYDPSDNSWTRVSRIPGLRDDHFLKGFAMVSIGESLFVISGRLCHKEKVHVSDELAGLVDTEVEMLSMVLRYDIGLDLWSRRASLGTPRSDFACVLCDGKVYVAGGQSTIASERGVSTAEVYDPVADAWHPLPNMNTTRYKCVGVTLQGKILVVGGFAERLDSDKASPFITERSSAEVFDPSTGRWELMAKMWQLEVPPRQIVDVEGKLFSSGDCLKAWKGHIEAYDGSLNMWNEVESSCNRSLSDVLCTQPLPQINQLYLTMASIGKRATGSRSRRCRARRGRYRSPACSTRRRTGTRARGRNWSRWSRRWSRSYAAIVALSEIERDNLREITKIPRPIQIRTLYDQPSPINNQIMNRNHAYPLCKFFKETKPVL
ncbi:hypothetical protein MLD38_010028 [Melastoma candidum]|uniref:Uncharacterized protein n=1 Tax=Melastoma candidum TaxID=119954 RepID=A0ACB9R6W3_9MYRT|nr:hypothetical protein MLD38_010028 [Melastoma candidum]